jgi:hypothetical protein
LTLTWWFQSFWLSNGVSTCAPLRGGRDSLKFKELSDTLHRELQLVAAAASVSAASLQMEEVEQGRQLKAKIDQLGAGASIQLSARLAGLLT